MSLYTRLLTKIIQLYNFNITHYTQLINMLNNSHVKQHFLDFLLIICLLLS